MSDFEFEQLKTEVDRLWELSEAAHQAADIATKAWLDQWSRMNTEKARRKMRAEVLREMAESKS